MESVAGGDKAASGATGDAPLPPPSPSEALTACEWPAGSPHALIVELLGDSAAPYFPESLLHRVAACSLDAPFSLDEPGSDTEDDPATGNGDADAAAPTRHAEGSVCGDDDDDGAAPQENGSSISYEPPSDPTAWVRALLSSLCVLALSLYVGLDLPRR